MATLAEQGRITLAMPKKKLPFAARLADAFRASPLAEEIDLFDQRQLETVLEVCRRHHSLSDAGRELFAVSRLKKPGRMMLTVCANTSPASV
jgi:transcriptional regulatory protein RtcR